MTEPCAINHRFFCLFWNPDERNDREVMKLQSIVLPGVIFKYTWNWSFLRIYLDHNRRSIALRLFRGRFPFIMNYYGICNTTPCPRIDEYLMWQRNFICVRIKYQFSTFNNLLTNVLLTFVHQFCLIRYIFLWHLRSSVYHDQWQKDLV